MHEACVHIVDDEEAVRSTLSFAISSAGYATRIYASAEQLLAAKASLAPGCLVTDVRLPGIDGVDLVRKLRGAGVMHPVVVISGKADISLAVEAMKAGAADFLEKPFRTSALVAAIGAIVEKERAKSGAPQELLAFQKALATLSPRQAEVLEGIIRGKLNKTIAHELGLSVRTVESYRAEIMAKTQVSSLGELVRMTVLAQQR